MATCFITANHSHGLEVLNASPNSLITWAHKKSVPQFALHKSHPLWLITLTCIWTGKSHKNIMQCLGLFSGIPAPIIALSSNGRFIQTSIYVQELSVKRSRETLIPLAWKLIRENNWMACRFSDIWVRAARYACLQILCEQDKIDFRWIWIVTLGCFIKYHSFRKWSEACSVLYLLYFSTSYVMKRNLKENTCSSTIINAAIGYATFAFIHLANVFI